MTALREFHCKWLQGNIEPTFFTKALPGWVKKGRAWARQRQSMMSGARAQMSKTATSNPLEYLWMVQNGFEIAIVILCYVYIIFTLFQVLSYLLCQEVRVCCRVTVPTQYSALRAIPMMPPLPWPWNLILSCLTFDLILYILSYIIYLIYINHY